jgi:hypothetical protein
MVSATIPLGEADEFVNIYLMETVVASKGIVEPQGAILKVILKPLGIYRKTFDKR